MASWTYLALDLGALFSALILIKFWKITINFRALILSYLVVVLPFILWDSWAVSAGHWSFNPEFITGNYIGNLALEEVLFFVSVPLVMLTIFEKVQSLHRFKGHASTSIVAFASRLLIALGVILLFGSSGGYSRIVSVVYLIFVFGLQFGLSGDLSKFGKGEMLHKRSFWVFQVVLSVLFLIFNTALTALPIIEYGNSAISGIRIGTIPVEDFFYNFVLINAFVIAYKVLRAGAFKRILVLLVGGLFSVYCW